MSTAWACSCYRPRPLWSGVSPTIFRLSWRRGKIHQLRNQCSDWTLGGLILPDALHDQIRKAAQAFGRAASLNGDAASIGHARQALLLAHQAALGLVQTYISQVFEVRHLRQEKLDTVWACHVPCIPPDAQLDLLRDSFNAVTLPISWQVIEPREGQFEWEELDRRMDWAARHFKVIGGPIFDFSGRGLADWIWTRDRDLHAISAYLNKFASEVVSRYKDRVRVWRVTAASNWTGVLATNDEEMIWLTVRLIEAIRKVDPQAEVVIGLSQPWGEYLAHQEHKVTPFGFADTLLRTGVRLDGLELEVVMGVTPRGNFCRDPLDLSRLLDLYVLLGVPIHVTLGYPSASKSETCQGCPDQRPHGGRWGAGFTPQDQADWARSFARLAMCKPYVQAVIWAHWQDNTPHIFPHCGLIDAQGKAKPAIDLLRQLREEHLR